MGTHRWLKRKGNIRGNGGGGRWSQGKVVRVEAGPAFLWSRWSLSPCGLPGRSFEGNAAWGTGCQSVLRILEQQKGRTPVFFSRWEMKWRTERQRGETHWVGAPAPTLASSRGRSHAPLNLSFHICEVGKSRGFSCGPNEVLFGTEQIFIKLLLHPIPIPRHWGIEQNKMYKTPFSGACILLLVETISR